MLFVTVLVTVSVLAFVLSVAGFTVSTFIELSDVVFDDEMESTFAESAAPPDLLPLHAAKDREITIAKKATLKEFFMVCMFKVLIPNKFEMGMFA